LRTGFVAFTGLRSEKTDNDLTGIREATHEQRAWLSPCSKTSIHLERTHQRSKHPVNATKACGRQNRLTRGKKVIGFAIRLTEQLIQSDQRRTRTINFLYGQLTGGLAGQTKNLRMRNARDW